MGRVVLGGGPKAKGDWLDMGIQGVILEIELEGARQVRQTFPESLQVFVLPPSLAELEHRIRQRGQDSEAAIARRLSRARVEIEAAPEFDIQIVNDHLESALKQLEQVVLQASIGGSCL